MTERTLNAWVRSRQEMKTRPSRRLRRQGFISAVVYGKAVPNGNLPIKLLATEVKKVLGTGIPEIGTALKLRIDTGDQVLEFDAMVREVQWNPMHLTLSHFDFFVPAEIEEKTKPEELSPAA
ncbi:MAG: hypothetical protein NZ805_08470 [Armatimonadetes bacterium]|nr:hypothetical protein [Armatimonadota bacterium]MDW8028727.1 hypothetical protein [Armatimonadota bacterium]